MRRSLVQHLLCPATHAPLRLESDAGGGDRVLRGTLVSTADATVRYPVRRGVPRFVDVAVLADADQRATVESFSSKWARIPGYAHERATKRNREAWYFERFGFRQGDADVRRFLSDSERVLEAGTGTGVDTDLLARNFDGLLFGVDISDAIDTAYERFGDEPRIALLQADLGLLPFPGEFFDVISCDQVLHHTPDPRGNFARLVAHLRPGGQLLLYLYKVKAPLRELADDHLRALLTAASEEEALRFTASVTRLGRDLSRLGARIEVEEDIPELGIAAGDYDLQRLLYDHVLKCFWNDDYDFETNAMINYDWYRPRHAFRYRPEEIERWCEEEGLEIRHFDVSPSGISVIARR